MENINNDFNKKKDFILKDVPENILDDTSSQWLAYVNNNINSVEGIDKCYSIGNYLDRIKKGDSKENINKEIGTSNDKNALEISTMVNIFSPHVLRNLNKPTYEEDNNVTTEVPEDERIFTPEEEVTQEVPEDERIELIDKNKIAREFFELIKRPEITTNEIVDILDIYARTKGAPCEKEETRLNAIVTYKGVKTIRRAAYTNILISNNLLELAKMVVNDPQAMEDAALYSKKIEEERINSELEQKFNKKYVDEEGKPIPIPKVPKM